MVFIYLYIEFVLYVLWFFEELLIHIFEINYYVHQIGRRDDKIKSIDNYINDIIYNLNYLYII